MANKKIIRFYFLFCKLDFVYLIIGGAIQILRGYESFFVFVVRFHLKTGWAT